jgi:hypothetical protein
MRFYGAPYISATATNCSRPLVVALMALGGVPVLVGV